MQVAVGQEREFDQSAGFLWEKVFSSEPDVCYQIW